MDVKTSFMYKLLVFFLAIGALISFYLLYAKLTSTAILCPNDGCDVVAQSRYSVMLGLPVAAWGVLYYCIMIVITAKVYRSLNKFWFNILGVGVGWGCIYSLYLRYLEIFKLNHFCVWCWGSVVIIIISLVIYLFMLKANKKGG